MITESKFFNISDKNNKKALQKWTNSCERCFQRGHLAHNCRNPLRNKKYKNNPSKIFTNLRHYKITFYIKYYSMLFIIYEYEMSQSYIKMIDVFSYITKKYHM